MSVEPRGNGWRARYRDASGRQHTRQFRTKALAQEWEQEQRVAVRRGVHRDPSAGRILLVTYAEQWRAAQIHHSDGSVRVFEQSLRVHIYPTLGHLRMSSVSRSHIRSLVALWAKAAAPRTVRLRYAVLAALFHAAVLDGVVPETPCRGMKLPEIPPELVVPLSVSQVRDLHDAIDPLFQPAVLLGAGCGARASEALGFTKPRVLFLRREVLFAKQVSAQRPWRLVDLKTKSSRATVPAPSFVLDALAPLCAHPGPGGLLFVRDGGPVPAGALHAAMRRAVRAVGLAMDTTFHDLRHHYASMLIDGGASPKVVAGRLRHRTATLTMDTYAHLWPDDDEKTLRILAGAWAGVDASEVVPGAGLSG